MARNGVGWRLPTLAAAVIVLLASAGVALSGLAPAPRPHLTNTSGPTTIASRTTTVTSAAMNEAAAPPPLSWLPCHGSHQCAVLDVPLDYGAPRGPHIAIGLERQLAGDAHSRIGSLVLNPGGPGESGLLNFSKDLALLPQGVLARFDIIAFDPRGIGQSSPIHCIDSGSTGPAPDPIPQTAADARNLLAADRAYTQGCLRGSGALLLIHAGTVDVARDLEQLRRALGDPKLSYLGLSYGTLLGATYAGMFPTHVRAMVLDGALDPSLSTEDLANAQAVGFEHALDAFFAWCTAAPGECGWHPTGDPRQAFEALAATVRAHPLPVAKGTLGPQAFFTGTFGTLYAKNFWPSLGRALAGLAAGQGALMQGLFDSYQHTGDPSFSGDANNAVTCLDHPVPRDPSVYPERARTAATLAPDFGALFAWGGLSCAVWPAPESALRPVGPIHAPGSPPILVVGTTEDPATPFAWARSLASQLEHGVLLTRVGVDHVAIFTSSCVRAFDEVYLVTLQAPAAGTSCPA